MQWHDRQPIYQQLKEMIRTSIIEGSLKEGKALPSIRHISAEYRINPLTVLKAYQALAHEDIIEKRRGLGMFVKKSAQAKLLESEKQHFLEEEWPLILEKIKRLGLDVGDITK